MRPWRIPPEADILTAWPPKRPDNGSSLRPLIRNRGSGSCDSSSRTAAPPHMPPPPVPEINCVSCRSTPRYQLIAREIDDVHISLNPPRRRTDGLRTCAHLFDCLARR